MPVRSLFSVGVLALAACTAPATDGNTSDGGFDDAGPADGGPADAGHPDAGTRCKMLWTAITSGTATATVQSGDLILTGPAETNDALALSQGGLGGDFTLTVHIASFSADAPVSALNGFSATVVNSSSNASLSAAMLNGEVFARFSPGDGSQVMDDTQAASPTDGTIQFVRQGNSVTVTLTAGGKTATQTGDLGNGLLTFLLAVSGPVSGHSTVVHVSDVSVAGSTGAFEGDTFDCDSVSR